jgi:hypothetical protein
MPDKTLKLPEVVTIPEDTTRITTSDGSVNIKLVKEIQPKEMIIAGAGLLVSAIIFFIIKNYLSKQLVSNYKKSPRSAETAGWSLFGFLMLVAIGASLGILDATRLLSLPYLLPIGVALLVMLFVFIMALISKR